jgi:hypothetical protein
MSSESEYWERVRNADPPSVPKGKRRINVSWSALVDESKYDAVNAIASTNSGMFQDVVDAWVSLIEQEAIRTGSTSDEVAHSAAYFLNGDSGNCGSKR